MEKRSGKARRAAVSNHPVANAGVTQRLTYSISEATRALGIGRTKLYELIRDGHLDARKFGRRTIILADDLHSFVADLPTLRN